MPNGVHGVKSYVAPLTRAPPCDAMPLWPPLITVVDLETGEEFGTFETEAEAAACLVFAGLRPPSVPGRRSPSHHD